MLATFLTQAMHHHQLLLHTNAACFALIKALQSNLCSSLQRPFVQDIAGPPVHEPPGTQPDGNSHSEQNIAQSEVEGAGGDLASLLMEEDSGLFATRA